MSFTLHQSRSVSTCTHTHTHIHTHTHTHTYTHAHTHTHTHVRAHTMQMVVSFNVRSVGKNKDGNTVGDRVLELFLHSLGAILTSVQDTEMKCVGSIVHTYKHYCMCYSLSHSHKYDSCVFVILISTCIRRFSLFHMEYQMKTGRALTTKLVKHYRTQVRSFHRITS